MNRVFFFGYGYTATLLARLLGPEGWKMAGTTRDQTKVNRMWDEGVEPHIWAMDQGTIEAPRRVLKNVTHILHSLPPTAAGDPVLKTHFEILKTAAPNLKWYGYLSTVSVYGDTNGEVATEDYAVNPGTPRGKLRLRVEQRHRQLFKKHGLPIHIFRAGAIYGPGRSALRRASESNPDLIHKEGHVTSRIHVEDLARILKASMENPNPGSVYNCIDDLQTGPEVPLEYAYQLLGLPIPPTVEYEDLDADVAKAVGGLYGETRRVSNAKFKSELGVQLKYPTYKEGYDALNEARAQRIKQAAD